MSIIAWHRRASEHFGMLVATVAPDQWTAPTPCGDWDVRTVVNHVTGEDLWTPPLLAGATIAQVGDRFDGDVLDDDPVTSYRAASAVAVGALGVADLTRTVHLSFGDHPAEEYAWQLFADHLIHGWDLAVAIGADDTLDPDLVAACAEWFAEREEFYRAAGVVAARPPVPAGADPQTRLLAGFGRARPR